MVSNSSSETKNRQQPSLLQNDGLLGVRYGCLKAELAS
jgi:hypothetical protein